MMANYYKYDEKKNVDFSLDGMIQIYKDIQKVNAGVVERLWEATKTDSTINALVRLDIPATSCF